VDQALAQTELELEARLTEARIAQAHVAVEGAEARARLLGGALAPSLEESLRLLQRSFQAGELGLLELSVARERFLGAQREALAAAADYDRALIELEFRVGTELETLDSLGGGR
jgi:cobalt-zinc-cadmium efflux system outer membrane protein